MSPDIFQRALLATARVACCAAFIGCASRPEEKKDSTPVIVAPTSTPVSAPVTVAASVPMSAPASTPTSATSLAACETNIKNVFVAKSAAPSEETKVCCQQIAERVGFDTSKWAERDECCSLLNWNGSAACTPWGPPCPPSMNA
jgi:hypothetical protein